MVVNRDDDNQEKLEITKTALIVNTPIYPRFSPSRQRLKYFIAGLCFLAEVIHLGLLPNQYELFVVYGIVFLLIAMGQGLIGGLLLFEPRRQIMTFGIWLNLSVVALYLFTHTVGVVVGLAFLPLPVDWPGIIVTLLELGIVGGLIMLRRDFKRVKKPKKLRKAVSLKKSLRQ